MNPREDQLCADTINTIIRAHSNSKAASVTVVENKAKIIADFIMSGMASFKQRQVSKAASETIPEPKTEFGNRLKLIHDFIQSNGKIF